MRPETQQNGKAQYSGARGHAMQSGAVYAQNIPDCAQKRSLLSNRNFSPEDRQSE